MIWGVRSCLSACAYTTTSTVETAWTMWYYYSLFAYLITVHTNNFSNATVYIVIIILCIIGGLPDRYVITFMRLMSPFYYKFVFTDIQIPQGQSSFRKTQYWREWRKNMSVTCTWAMSLLFLYTSVPCTWCMT